MTEVYDANGDACLQCRFADSDFGSASRRRTRSKTLDGGYVTEDRGYSAADKSMQISFTASEELTDKLEHLIKSYSTLLLSYHEGVVRVSADRVLKSTSQNTITLFVDVEQEF